MEKTATQTKYYTPEIEEFHVGFEFYIDNKPHICTRVELLPIGSIVSGSSINSSVNNRKFNKFKLEDVRLKHLDREDIESLGFEFLTQGNVNNFTFQLKLDNFIRLSVAYGEPAQISVHKYGDYDWLPKAFIKNKSELKRILTQIGVL